MSAFIGQPGVRKRDFFDGPLESLYADAVMDLEEVSKYERKASKKVGSEFFRSEGEDQSSDSGSGKEGRNVDPEDREDEDESESPDEDRGGVFEKGENLLGERARFENFGKGLVERDERDGTGEPEAGDGT